MAVEALRDALQGDSRSQSGYHVMADWVPPGAWVPTGAWVIAAAMCLLGSNQRESQQLQTEEIHKNLDFYQRKSSNATIRCRQLSPDFSVYPHWPHSGFCLQSTDVRRENDGDWRSEYKNSVFTSCWNADESTAAQPPSSITEAHYCKLLRSTEAGCWIRADPRPARASQLVYANTPLILRPHVCGRPL